LSSQSDVGPVRSPFAIAPVAVNVDGQSVLARVFTDAGDGLYRFILVRVRGDRDVAADLLQQTCCEAVRHRRHPADADECEAWLRGIARNLVRRHWRRLRRTPVRVRLDDTDLGSRLAEDLASRPLPLDELIRAEVVERMLLTVTSLPAAEQELVFAYYFDGRAQAEIARELGVSEKSVECRLSRVRAKLRTALRDSERSGAE
jgi:RNA polymerase sigma-70 factor (ECF subfamily)